MPVPFVDLQAQYRAIADDIKAAMSGVLDTSAYILGPQVAAFEQAFAAYCGVKHCIGVASGLDALTLALRGLDVGPGDEVILPANTFIATALAVSLAGATPVMADCREDDFQIDPVDVERRITPKTKVILPVHLYGRLAPMRELHQLAERHGLMIVEDAAQAHGARDAFGQAGAMGRAGCFSFYPGKNLGAYGDGGAVTTSDDALAKRLRQLRNYGSDVKYVHEEQGVNSRLDSLQAAVLSVKLKHLDSWNLARRERAGWYHQALENAGVVRPALHFEQEHVWHLYVIRSCNRDALQAHLHSRGIMAQLHYPIPVHLQPCYRGQLGEAGDFPVAERLASLILSLPIYPELTEEQVQHIAREIRIFN